MAPVASETAIATTPTQTLNNPIQTRVNSSSAQSVKDKKFSPRKLPIASTSLATSCLSLLLPTVMHVENMGHSQQPPSKAPDAVIEPVAQHVSEIGATDIPSKHHAGVPRDAAPDSACILMTPENHNTKTSDVTPAFQDNNTSDVAAEFQDTNPSDVAPACPRHGEIKIMTSKEQGQEKAISELLNKPNLDKDREEKLPPAEPVKTETRGAGASSLHPETQKPCNCLHVNEFSRILHADDFFWATNVDVSGFFKYPPPDMTEVDEKMKEAVVLTFHQSSLRGFETEELMDFVDVYANNSQAYEQFLKQQDAEVQKLREERRVKFQTSSQIQANAEALFEQIKRRPGANISRVQRETLRSANAMKARLDADVREITAKLNTKLAATNEFIERTLLADFDPAKIAVEEKNRAQAAETLKAQKEWETDMMSLHRVKEGAATTFRKRAWMWHRVDSDHIQPKMSTYPNGRVTAKHRPPSPVPITNPITEKMRVPDWFTILDSSGRVELEGRTPEARYKFLLTGLHNLQTARWREESEGTAVASEKDSQKQWHDENPGWPHPHQRQYGGWWKCRTGLDATPAEQACRVCHQPQSSGGVQKGTKPDPTPSQSTGEPTKSAQTNKRELSASQRHKRLVAEIERAMDQCNEKEKAMLRARMQMQRRETEELDHSRFVQQHGPRGKDDAIKIYIIGPKEEQAHQEVVCYGGTHRK